MNLFNKTIIWSLALVLVCFDNAYAYLDPGTGSYILQMALAALVGGLYTIKLYWRNIKGYFSKSKNSDGNE